MQKEIFINGEDKGYVDNTRWWWEGDNAFRISTSDDYPKEYFKEDHVGALVVENYCNAVIREFELLKGRRLKSIIEFGSGGGWFTKEFKDRGYRIEGYEGSNAGRRVCEERWLYNVSKKDFRLLIEPPSDKYDIALCTEVAGHIEPPFSAILVKNLISHSDVIWWSSEVPGFSKPHLHHPNEQPLQYWINIFDFYGYTFKMLPDEVFNKCEGRGRVIFYKK